MIQLLPLLLIPLAVAGFFFFILKSTITWQEFLLMVGVGVLAAVGGYFLARWGGMQDTEYWNGRITAKDHDTIKCCHCRMVCDRYEDRCTSRDKKNNCTSTSRECVSEHEECDHIHDEEWTLRVNTGDTVTAMTCAAPGTPAPSAWVAAKIGDAASVAHRYTNYLLADPDSLFRSTITEEQKKLIPTYPGIRGLYKRQPVVHKGIPELQEWSRLLFEVNADLGGAKKIDITMLVTDSSDRTYAQTVEAAWIYGPKNSLNIIAGTDGKVFTWVEVVSISPCETLKVELRDALEGFPLNKPKEGVALISSLAATHFDKISMEEFKHLAPKAKVKGWKLWLLYLLVLAVSIGIGIWCHREDVFGTEGFSFRRRRRW